MWINTYTHKSEVTKARFVVHFHLLRSDCGAARASGSGSGSFGECLHA